MPGGSAFVCFMSGAGKNRCFGRHTHFEFSIWHVMTFLLYTHYEVSLRSVTSQVNLCHYHASDPGPIPQEGQRQDRSLGRSLQQRGLGYLCHTHDMTLQSI